MFHRGTPLCILAAGLCLHPISAGGKTWSIKFDGSGDVPTVQGGIDSAGIGDTVLVYPGTYPERINFRGKNIVVRSNSGPEVTILDGTGLGGRVVTFSSGESRLAVLEGFMITGGEGGIILIEAEPSVIGNIISANTAAQDGGGILGDGDVSTPPFWSPLIKSNRIVNNHSSNLAGGIGFYDDMVPEILDNFIADNDTQRGDGAGIYYRNWQQGTAVIRGNIIKNNRAGDHGGGIYVALLGSPPPSIEVEISWNLIVNNHAPGSTITGQSGGGITLIESNAWVHHNTIATNEGGPSQSTPGGGIAIERPGSPLIEQNIIALNSQGGGIFCFQGATPVIRNNLAWHNSGGDGLGACSGWWQSNGNVVDNPYFCDLGVEDYRVASNSGVMTHPAGPLGVYSVPGCGPVSVQLSTWGALKARY